MASKGLRAQPTTEEIIATLNHSNLPTLIIEGDDDVLVFRRFEQQAENLTLSVMPVGGRSQVLSLFKRSTEIKSKGPIAFVADLDLWVLSSVPAEYIADNLIFTDGYSIENDVFRDIDCATLLMPAELNTFIGEVERYLVWYALSASRCLAGGNAVLDIHPNRLLNSATEWTALTALEPLEQYPQALHDRIRGDYQRFVRGKSLFQVFLRRMTTSRSARHSKAALLEMAGVKPGPLIQAMFEKVRISLT